MNLVWSVESLGDLAAMRAFFAPDDPAAARRLVLRLVEAVETMIPANSRVGRPGRVPGTRELVVAGTSYIVPYRIRDGRIEILRVLHGARRWPERL